MDPNMRMEQIPVLETPLSEASKEDGKVLIT